MMAAVDTCFCPGALPAITMPEGGWNWCGADYDPKLCLMYSLMHRAWILDSEKYAQSDFSTDLLLVPVTYSYKDAPKEYIVIHKALLAEAIRDIQTKPDAEQGCIVGCSMTDPNYLTHYYFDKNGIGDHQSYIPRTEDLNAVLETWNQDHVAFAGLVHSHPGGNTELSPGDLKYVRSILQENSSVSRVLIGVLADRKLFLYGFQRDYLSI